jgi:hypothetical protein
VAAQTRNPQKQVQNEAPDRRNAIFGLSFELVMAPAYTQ